MEAPFKVGGAVEPPYFVGREKDLQVLAQSAQNLDQNFLILAPRRFGKTSLLLNLRRRLASERSLLVPYVNCRNMTGPQDFYFLLLRALLEELEYKRGLKGLWQKVRTVFGEKVLGAFKALEEIGGEVAEWGKVYLRFREQEIAEPELIRAALSFPTRVATEHRIGVVFLLDEFQEVAKFNSRIFSALKAEMDCTSTVRYFFSGSSLGLMREIFLRENSPFYLMVTRYRLGPLGREEAVEFLQKRFAICGMKARPDVLVEMYNLTGGIPFYLQMLGLIVFRRMLIERRTTVEQEDLDQGFEEMLEGLDGEFEVRWLSEFSPLQRRVLRALAKLGRAGVTEVAQNLNVKPSDISSTLARLREEMVIDRDDASYHIVDFVFARWIANF